MEAIKELGERIKAERIAQGHSIKSAAEASGLARDTWKKIEAGGSVQDTKRHAAMRLLGISERNADWGTVGSLEDHAAEPGGVVDMNVMFSQAVRFTATVGVLVPSVREEAERVSVALSDLFAHAHQAWDRNIEYEDRFFADTPDVEIIQSTKAGGDGDADSAGGAAPMKADDYELAADDGDGLTIEEEQGHDEHP